MSLENYITNPLNNRPIKKGCMLYRRLVLEGHIIHDYENDPVALEEYDETMNINLMRDEWNKTLKEEYKCCIGRGIYEGWLVRRKIRCNEKKNKHKNIFSYKII